MKNLSYAHWIILIFLVFLIIFIMQNLGEVQIQYLIFDFSFPLFLVIGISFIIGFFSGKLFDTILPKIKTEKRDGEVQTQK